MAERKPWVVGKTLRQRVDALRLEVGMAGIHTLLASGNRNLSRRTKREMALLSAVSQAFASELKEILDA